MKYPQLKKKKSDIMSLILTDRLLQIDIITTGKVKMTIFVQYHLWSLPCLTKTTFYLLIQ